MTQVDAGRGDTPAGSWLVRRVAGHGRIAASLAGAALPLAYAPFGFYIVTPVCLAALLYCLDGVTPREAGWRGFWFGVGAFLAGTYWLYISLHVFGKVPVALAVPLMLALVAFMAGYVALVGWAGARLAPAVGAVRWLVAMPALWALAEWLRGWVLSGFPWLAVGYSQTDSALAGYAPVAGVFAVGWLVAVSAGALRCLVEGDRRLRLIGAAVLAIVWGAGLALDRIGWSTASGMPLDVRVVQGAVPQDQKWLPGQLEPTMALYRRLTAANLDADLVIWPEAAIPALRNRIPDYYRTVGAMVRQTGTSLLVGAIEYRQDTEQYLNGVIALGADSGAYYKRHLVPFGEFFPVPGFVRNWMRLMSLPYTDYSPGPAYQAPLAVAGQRIGVSVCYEDVFGEELLDALPEATLLVNVSNDAWFGDSVAPHQHLQIARMRAIEAARPMIRATNTGVSALIDARGQVRGVSPQFRTHVLAGTVQPTTGTTPYMRLGNAGVVSLCAGLLAVVAVWARRRSS